MEVNLADLSETAEPASQPAKAQLHWLVEVREPCGGTRPALMMSARRRILLVRCQKPRSVVYLNCPHWPAGGAARARQEALLAWPRHALRATRGLPLPGGNNLVARGERAPAAATKEERYWKPSFCPTATTEIVELVTVHKLQDCRP
jgi:hypothetical protein